MSWLPWAVLSLLALILAIGFFWAMDEFHGRWQNADYDEDDDAHQTRN